MQALGVAGDDAQPLHRGRDQAGGPVGDDLVHRDAGACAVRGEVQADPGFPGRPPPACNTSSCSGTDTRTVVVSSRTTGHAPTEWWARVPTPGHPESTSRIREAPTTHPASDDPSASTAHTAPGGAMVVRDTVGIRSPPGPGGFIAAPPRPPSVSVQGARSSTGTPRRATIRSSHPWRRRPRCRCRVGQVRAATRASRCR